MLDVLKVEIRFPCVARRCPDELGRTVAVTEERLQFPNLNEMKREQRKDQHLLEEWRITAVKPLQTYPGAEQERCCWRGFSGHAGEALE